MTFGGTTPKTARVACFLKRRNLFAISRRNKPVRIEAFVSGSVPKHYAQTKLDLINYLNEFRALNGSKINVVIHDGLEPFSETADIARETYGIVPREVISQERGALAQEEVILGAAVQRGLDKVVIPF